MSIVLGTGDPAHSQIEILQLLALYLWPVISLCLAKGFGVFQVRQLDGPDRFGEGEPANSLLIVFLIGMAVPFILGGHLGRLFPFLTVPAERSFAQGSAAQLASLLVMLVLIPRTRSYGGRRMGINLGRLAPGILLGVIAFAIVMPWMFWLGQGVEWIIRHYKFSVDTRHLVFQMWPTASVQYKVVLAITAVVVAPIWEELIFRGAIQTLFLRLLQITQRPYAAGGVVAIPTERAAPSVIVPGKTSQLEPARPWHRWAAIAIASIAFTAFHEPYSWPMIFLLSVGLGYVYERFGNLWASISLHVLFNGANFLLFLLSGRH